MWKEVKYNNGSCQPLHNSPHLQSHDLIFTAVHKFNTVQYISVFVHVAASEQWPWTSICKFPANSRRAEGGTTVHNFHQHQLSSESKRKREKETEARERTRARRREESGWTQSMDAVRIEGTARSSLTRKRKISKLSRRIETRRQVGLTLSLSAPSGLAHLCLWKGNF